VPRYADEDKEKVRDATDFVALVSARTELRRTGGDGFMGLCPFHDERSPSFSVSASKKVFNCFGCGEAGDVYRFVELTEGVDFKGALELLADRAGIELEPEEEDPRAAERRKRRERLLELLERTAAYYVRVLWEADEAAKAREYLLGRGLDEGVLREFRVGYAPSKWDRVLTASMRSGFTSHEIYDAGLAQKAKGEGRLYDRFRSRIMFPLADSRGRVLGFGARAMGDSKPKYLNTAENEVFHKGRQLYAADLARAAAAKAGAAILCEGYTDVIALHQAGLRNAVATMGTALTEEQVVELARMAPVVQMALDADAAGQGAMLRAAKVAAGRRLELRVVPLPEGRDPADVVAAEGADAVRALVERSVPFVQFRVERALAAGNVRSAEGKDHVLEELRPVFATLGPSVLRDELLRTVADRLDVGPSLVAELVGRPGRGQAAAGGGAAAAPVPANGNGDAARAPRRQLDRAARTQRAFLTQCLARPSEGRGRLAAIDLDGHFTDDPTRRAAAWLRDHIDDPLTGVPSDDDELTVLLQQLTARAAALPEGAVSLEVETLQLELARIDRRITSAGAGEVADFAKRRGEVQRELDDAVERALA